MSSVRFVYTRHPRASSFALERCLRARSIAGALLSVFWATGWMACGEGVSAASTQDAASMTQASANAEPVARAINAIELLNITTGYTLKRARALFRAHPQKSHSGRAC